MNFSYTTITKELYPQISVSTKISTNKVAENIAFASRSSLLSFTKSNEKTHKNRVKYDSFASRILATLSNNDRKSKF